jgi:8-oxo-dGTP pyrophosphatase MutT (NUDIX family)
VKSLPPVDVKEVRALRRKFGEPRRVVVPLTRWPMPRGTRSDRRGEVVFAIRDRADRVLVHAKGFYPIGVYRLPGGGIHRDESVEAALFREVEEETGLPVQVDAFVALVEYAVRRRRQPFATYLFLLSTERLRPRAQDPNEPISEFRKISSAELLATGERLRKLPPKWRVWGQFRAVTHVLAAQVIQSQSGEG